MIIEHLKRVSLLLAMVLSASLDLAGQSNDSLHYELDAQIGGQRKRGVFSQTAFKTTVNAKLENQGLILSNLSSYTYTNVNGTTIANDWHFRTILMFKLNSTNRVLPVIAHNYFKNVLYRIQDSHRGLAGLRFVPFKKNIDFSLTLGAGYETSKYTNEIFENSLLVSNQREFGLVFFNLSGKHQIEKLNLLFRYNLSAVQSLVEANDYSFWLTSGLSLPVNKKISVGLNYDYRFRNVHLEDIPSVNDLLLFNLRIKLSK